MRILTNARIYTLDSALPFVTALAIERGRILAIGHDQAIPSDYGEHAARIDLEGLTILPGLTDAHIHLEQYALGLQKVDCETATKAECLERIAERARATPPGEWILGHGWDQNDWPEGFGTAADLDSVAPDHPVYLTAKSLHAAWANSAAIRLAGITSSTSDPPGGRIQRHSSGEPAGILFEAAMSLVSEVIPSQGLDALSIGSLMQQVKLTHGGFYGHFASRSDLIAAALEQALTLGEASARASRDPDKPVSVNALVRSYLSRSHRDSPKSGCAIGALISDVGRADVQCRAVMEPHIDLHRQGCRDALRLRR